VSGGSLLTEEIAALVGTTATYTAPDELGRASIRYFARAVGDDNPLYRDEAYARANGYDGVVAPPTLVCETNQYADRPRDDDGYAGHVWAIEVPGTRLVRGGNEYTFHRALHPEDVITASWRIASIVEHVSSSGLPMLIVESVASYTNQGRELLATNSETLIYQAMA
jgi:acyl dehydratase